MTSLRLPSVLLAAAALAMTAAQRASIHGVDEWVTIDSLDRGERFHRALMTALPD